MHKKIKFTLVVVFSLLFYSFLSNSCYALTSKEVGEVLAQFAINFANNYGANAEEHGKENQTAYSWNDEHRGPAYNKIKTSGIGGGSGLSFTNKYAMDCVGWISFAMHHALGISSSITGSYGFEFFVVPTSCTGVNESIMEVVSGPPQLGDICASSGHVWIYVGNGMMVDSQTSNGVAYRAPYCDYERIYRMREDYAATLDKANLRTTFGAGDVTWDPNDLSDMLFIGDNVINSLRVNEISKEEGFKVEASTNATLSSILSDIDGYSGNKPKAIMLMAGINDIGSSNSDPNIDGLKKVIAKLKEKYDGVSIYVMSVLPTNKSSVNKGGRNYSLEKINKYNQLVEEYCNESLDATYIDVTANLLESDGYLKSTYASSDGISLNKKGGNVLIENIKTKMAEYYVDINSTGGSSSSSVIEGFVGEPDYVVSEGDTKTDFRIVDVNDKIAIYKHILLTEKYDFNRIQWKQYSHTKAGEDSPLKEDLVYGLKYPEDSNNTNLGKFVNLVLPYLQTWYIPLAMNSGVINSGIDETQSSTKGNPAFAYTILQNAYHDIIVNRYDLQKHVLTTKYKEYTQNTKHDFVTFTATQHFDDAGNPTYVTYDNFNIQTTTTKTEDIDERVNSAGNVDPMREEYVSSQTTETSKYYLAQARTFDMFYTNTFNYKKYSDADVNARRNAKSEIVAGREPYNETLEDEDRIVRISQLFGNSFASLSNMGVSGSFPDISNPQKNKSNYPNKFVTIPCYYSCDYIERDGYTVILNRTWEDSLSQSSSTSSKVTYDDLVSFNENKSGNSELETVKKEDFESKPSEGADIYRALSSKGELNKIDFVNSNPKLIDNYIKNGGEYKEYIGYSRGYLTMAYANLRNLVKKAVEKNDGVLPYAYFTSLGYEVKDAKTDSESVANNYDYNFAWPVNIEYNEGAKVIDIIYGNTPAFGTNSSSIYIAGGEGQNNILASKDGEIIEVTGNEKERYSILIKHEGEYYTRYSNLKSIESTIKKGAKVKQNDILGVMGENPETKKLYLEFQIYKDGRSNTNLVDPLDYFITEPEYGSIDPATIENTPSGYVFSRIKAGGSSLLTEYIRQWEHGATPPPTNADGTKYIIENDGYGNAAVGYGVDIFNGGFADLFIENGYPTYVGGEVDIDFVDALEQQTINNMIDQVNSRVSGLGLKEYQIHALVSRAYNCGIGGAMDDNYSGISNLDFVDSYKAYWNNEKDDLQGQSDANYEHKLYTTFMEYPRVASGQVSQGLIRRRKSEWRLFQTGYYDEIDKHY